MRLHVIATIACAFSVLVTAGSAAPVKPKSPVAEWEKWRAEENAAWATKEFAILKIDDAVYLNPGQSAWLTTRKQKALGYAWTLDALSAPSGLRVTYNAPGTVEKKTYGAPTASVTKNGKTTVFTLEKPQTVKVSPGVDVRFAPTQVKPTVDALRVMVYNQANPLAHEFKGLDHFAYNPKAVMSATFERLASPEGMDFQTSRGWYKRFYRMGDALFTIEGQKVRLPMYADTKDPGKVKSLTTFFIDNLSGRETYGVGRYLDVDVKGLPRTLTLDFNRAYNPNCARSPHYNCPYAIDKIPVALRAGEKMPPKH